MMEKLNLSRRANVLAVDDLPANLIALEAVLSDEYELHLANSGAEAVAIMSRRKDIDIVLMDLQMPEMDGFEAARRIKAIPGCEDLPIIFITAIYKEDAFVRRGYEAGGVDYFSKPFDPEILKRKVAIYSSFRQKANFLKERERQIRESEELLKVGRKLSTVLESLPVGVLIADVEGRICQTNEGVAKIIKYEEPAKNDAYGEILSWWDSSGHRIKEKDGPLARAINRAETSHNERLDIECFDGTAKTVLCSAAPLYGLDGKIMGGVVIVQDMTEPKRIEQDLEDRITKLVSIGIELEQSLNL